MALVVGTHYRDQIFDGSLGPGTIHYMHIKRSSTSNRTAGTMEVICSGELGGTQQGNGLAYFKSCWNSWNYITDGAHSIKVVDNIDYNFDLFMTIYKLYNLENPTVEPIYNSYPTTLKL